IYKHILRNAMKGILPESIRTRRQPNSLEPLYCRGVERENSLLRQSFENPDSLWRKFVRADWLLKRWNAVLPEDQDGAQAVVPWLCVSFESWHKSAIMLCRGSGGVNVNRSTHVA